MQDLPKIKQELRDALPKKGVSFLIKSLRELLPGDAPKLDILVGIEADFKKLKSDSFEGILSPDEESREGAKIRKRLLELLQSLEAEDFDPAVQRSHIDPEQKVRKGAVLYRIPKEMQLNEETRCIVRIAFDEEIILEDMEMDDDTQLKSGLRISDYMKVEIEDPSADGVFEIRTTSESVQLIDQDDFTEWRFYVKPIKAGEHVLELKVSIIMHIDGEDRIREKTLDESVVIIAEKPAVAEEDVPFVKLDDEGVVVPCALALIAPPRFEFLHKIPYNSLAMALIVGFAALMYMISSGIISDYSRWGSGSGSSHSDKEEVTNPDLAHLETEASSFDELRAKLDTKTTSAADKESLLLAYLAQNPGCENAAPAHWELAQLTGYPEDYQAYLQVPCDLAHQPAAQLAMANAEPKVWGAVQQLPNPVNIDRYLRLYPQGPHRLAAIELLAKKPTWKKPYTTTTPPRLAETDSLALVTRLLEYADEPQLPKTKRDILKYIEANFPPADQTAPRGVTPGSTPTGTNPPVVTPPKQTVPPGSAPTGTNPPVVTPPKPTVPPGSTPTGTNPPVVTPPKPPQEEPPFVPTPFSEPPVVRIPAGTFTMGCLSQERDGDCHPKEKPAHEVTLKSYSLGKYEVTVGEYLAFAEATNGNYPDWLEPGNKYHLITGTDDFYSRQGYSRQALDLPIAGVSYNDAVAYCRWLSKQTGKRYRLPTEAEWEYAARGGAVGEADDFLYSGGSNPANLGWYRGNSSGRGHPVGRKSPNQLGLYDMTGNVWEWCEDGWNTYPAEPQTNPRKTGLPRVRRGGCCNSVSRDLRNAVRIIRDPNEVGMTGFRVCWEQ